MKQILCAGDLGHHGLHQPSYNVRAIWNATEEIANQRNESFGPPQMWSVLESWMNSPLCERVMGWPGVQEGSSPPKSQRFPQEVVGRKVFAFFLATWTLITFESFCYRAIWRHAPAISDAHFVGFACRREHCKQLVRLIRLLRRKYTRYKGWYWAG